MSARPRAMVTALSLTLLAACGDDGSAETAASAGGDELGTGEGADTGSEDTSTSGAEQGSNETNGSATADDGSDGDSDGESDSNDGESSSDDGESSSDDGESSSDDGESSSDDGESSSDDGESSSDDGESSSSDDGESSSDDGESSSEEEESTETGDPITFDACGFPDDGVWVEIEYWQLGSVTSPSYSYSDTPGWGEEEWAYSGDWWPKVISIGNNSMHNDPIGIVAEISGTWQLMIGLQGLTSYDYATVCYEGRSVSVGSPATVDVYNPLNNCGVETQISHSWEVHAVGADLGNCLIPNNETQAVRLDPWGGSGKIGLKRLRLTLHGAVY